MKAIRWALVAVFGLLALSFGYVTLTVPAIAATAPAILTIGCLLGVYFAWPKKPKQAEVIVIERLVDKNGDRLP